MTATQQFYPLLGGLDQESSAIAIPPGRVISCLNHEAVSRGYQRTQGYERFDGHGRPSDAGYSTIEFTGGLSAFTVGETITGATSAATARVATAAVLTSGAWTGSGVGRVAVHNISGTFVSGEALQNGATRAILDGTPLEGDGLEDAEAIANQLAVTTYARNLIAKPTGSGPVRGVLWFQGVQYAWRDNAGATAGIMHKATTTGWQAVDLGKLLAFTSGGTYEIVAGDVITGATSGATATVRYVATDALGGWSTGDATGTLVLDNVVGTFVAENLNVPGNPNSATIAAAPTAAAFPPGGRYDFSIHNFYGTSGFERAYGANGVGPAFEFDGESIIPIATGMPDDRPVFVQAHKNHLFLGFPKGSLQHSDLGEPRSFTAILGAAELGMGHELTGMVSSPGGTLLVSTDYNLSVLLGNDSSDWQLEALSGDNTGAKAYTLQRVGQIIYLDERGVRSVAASQAYGGFRLGSYTNLIQRELTNKRRSGATPVASCVVKGKDQYLLFFSDGTGISVYFGRKNPEAMLFEYPFTVTCISVDEVDGMEQVIVGGDDGFVYELNRGTSFDGAAIDAYVQLPFGHQGGPRVLKRYHKIVTEIIAPPNTEISTVAEFDYGGGLQPYSHTDMFSGSSEGGAPWNIGYYAEFSWDNPLVIEADSYVQGVGANMSIILHSSSATMDSYILQGITILFSARGQKR